MTSLYSKPNKSLWFREKVKSIFINNNLKKLATQNELKDYKSILKEENDKLWKLHQKLETIRLEEKANYKSYDYGSGYYYQSFESLHISGYRNTEQRIQQLELDSRTKGKSVLDIGANAGFILLSIAESISIGTGIEFNPYLVKTAQLAKEYLEIKNTSFIASSFEDYSSSHQNFDIVLSLANHSTYDGNTKHSLHEYFKKIAELLNSDGQLIFESHPPEIEPEEKLEQTTEAIEQYFVIKEKPNVRMDGFLDKGRTYIIANVK
jgi:2-polyprenyl-3-methyl-5-hydroxy-6-metoxy-1,4-benzoquinol methylase